MRIFTRKYPGDLSNEQWRIIQKLLPPRSRRGRAIASNQALFAARIPASSLLLHPARSRLPRILSLRVVSRCKIESAKRRSTPAISGRTELGPFDIIFCRNVAIYFDLEVKRDLFVRLADVLGPDGYLFVGTSEDLSRLDPRFVPQRRLHRVFYQPNKPTTLATGQLPVAAN